MIQNVHKICLEVIPWRVEVTPIVEIFFERKKDCVIAWGFVELKEENGELEMIVNYKFDKDNDIIISIFTFPN